MDFTFDEPELERQLSELTEDGLLAFGLLCCERMIPNYFMFSQKNGWGNPIILRKALDFGWDRLLGELPSTSSSNLKEQCEENAPDTEDFESSLVSPALDAAVSIATLLELLEDRSPKHALEIACLARDTVDMYIQELENLSPGGQDLEEQIRSHKLMQTELRNQHDDLARVQVPFDKPLMRATFSGCSKGSILIAR